MKVFITGISGFLGRHLARQLVREGHYVSGVDNNPLTLQHLGETTPSIHLIEGSICDVEVLREIRHHLVGQDITHVVHLAANKYIEKNQESPYEAIKVNVMGSADIGQMCLELGIPLVAISTDKAVEPSCLYGHAKLMMEETLLSMGFSIYQGVNFFGSDGSVIPIWYGQYLSQQPLTVRNLDCVRYFTPVAQVVDELVDLLILGIPPGMHLPRTATSVTLAQILEGFSDCFDWHSVLAQENLPYEKLVEDIDSSIVVTQGDSTTVRDWIAGLSEFDLLQDKR